MNEQPDSTAVLVEKIARIGSLLAAIIFTGAFLGIIFTGVTGIWDAPIQQKLFPAVLTALAAIVGFRKYRHPFKWPQDES